MTIAEIANYAQTSAKKLGINKFDIYGSSVDETSVQVDTGEPKQVKASNRSSVMVRVWNADNTMGVTSTTNVDPKGLELALKTAYEASFFGVKDNIPDFSPEATTPLGGETQETATQVPVSELIETLVEAESNYYRLIVQFLEYLIMLLPNEILIDFISIVRGLFAMKRVLIPQFIFTPKLSKKAKKLAVRELFVLVAVFLNLTFLLA